MTIYKAGSSATAEELRAVGLEIIERWHTNNDYQEVYADGKPGPGCKACDEKNGKRRGDGWTENPPHGCTADPETGCRCRVSIEIA